MTDEQSQTLEYEIELGSSVGMNRRGWTPETIKVGDIIRFTGQPSRGPGSHGMCCGELTRADGSPIGGAARRGLAGLSSVRNGDRRRRSHPYAVSPVGQ